MFAPVAAHLSMGVHIQEFGPSLNGAELKTIALKPTVSDDRRIGSIVDIDEFGNVRTNIPNHIPGELLGRLIPFKLTAPNLTLDARARLVRTFGECSRDEPIFVLSSTGSLDLAVNLGNAAERFSISPDNIGLEGPYPTAKIELDLAHVA